MLVPFLKYWQKFQKTPLPQLKYNLIIFIELSLFKGPKCLLAVSDLYHRIVGIEEEIYGDKCAESFSATVKMGECVVECYEVMWCGVVCCGGVLWSIAV